MKTYQGQADRFQTMVALASSFQDDGIIYDEARRLFTRAWLAVSMKRHGNNQSAVAQAEGMHRNTIARKIKESGLPVRKGYEQRLNHGLPRAF